MYLTVLGILVHENDDDRAVSFALNHMQIQLCQEASRLFLVKIDKQVF